jgi:hypothetical protein
MISSNSDTTLFSGTSDVTSFFRRPPTGDPEQTMPDDAPLSLGHHTSALLIAQFCGGVETRGAGAGGERAKGTIYRDLLRHFAFWVLVVTTAFFAVDRNSKPAAHAPGKPRPRPVR